MSRPLLSATRLKLWGECQTAFRRIVIEGLEDPGGDEAHAGTFAHAVLAGLMARPGGERTAARADTIADRLQSRYKADHGWPDAVFANGRLGVSGAVALYGGEWSGWEVLHVEEPIRADVDGVPVQSTPDLIARIGDETVLLDWKTGRPPRREDRPEAFRQLVIYAILAKRTGLVESVDRITLAYTTRRTVLTLELTPALERAAAGELTRAAREVDDALVTGEWGLNPSALCSWRPCVVDCREGQAKTRQRIRDGLKVGRFGLDAV